MCDSPHAGTHGQQQNDARQIETVISRKVMSTRPRRVLSESFFRFSTIQNLLTRELKSSLSPFILNGFLKKEDELEIGLCLQHKLRYQGRLSGQQCRLLTGRFGNGLIEQLPNQCWASVECSEIQAPQCPSKGVIRITQITIFNSTSKTRSGRHRALQNPLIGGTVSDLGDFFFGTLFYDRKKRRRWKAAARE
ncbi:hypothetical protein EVAR_94659_1 [Eumeta japonica]|uniref:Uncharacterized protein n=1 Tax=Eumeta variegata TaxID=151549 RepID=A0A4C1UU47_EUMVA|nr:hypothetical protein EVAR_94659_1 [Eumeta japonica]